MWGWEGASDRTKSFFLFDAPRLAAGPDASRLAYKLTHPTPVIQGVDGASVWGMLVAFLTLKGALDWAGRGHQLALSPSSYSMLLGSLLVLVPLGLLINLPIPSQ